MLVRIFNSLVGDVFDGTRTGSDPACSLMRTVSAVALCYLAKLMTRQDATLALQVRIYVLLL